MLQIARNPCVATVFCVNIRCNCRSTCCNSIFLHAAMLPLVLRLPLRFYEPALRAVAWPKAYIALWSFPSGHSSDYGVDLSCVRIFHLLDVSAERLDPDLQSAHPITRYHVVRPFIAAGPERLSTRHVPGIPVVGHFLLDEVTDNTLTDR